MATGLRKPKDPVPGTDSPAGSGPSADVHGFDQGTRCSGGVAGAFAEYASASEDHFVLKPANLTFERGCSRRCVRDHRPPAPARRWTRPAGAEGPNQRRVRWRGHVRGADRQGSRRRGDGCCQLEEPGPGPARSGRTRSSTTRRRTSRKGGQTLRPHPRQRGGPSMSAIRRALAPGGTLLSNGGGHAGGKVGRVIRLAVVSGFVRRRASPPSSRRTEPT